MYVIWEGTTQTFHIGQNGAIQNNQGFKGCLAGVWGVGLGGVGGSWDGY